MLKTTSDNNTNIVENILPLIDTLRGKDEISFSDTYFLVECRLKAARELGLMKMPVHEKSLIRHYKRSLEYRCRCKCLNPIDI